MPLNGWDGCVRSQLPCQMKSMAAAGFGGVVVVVAVGFAVDAAGLAVVVCDRAANPPRYARRKRKVDADAD